VDPKRLLFASIHCYLDPSGGVALCTRELLEAPAARGAERRAFSASVLDYQHDRFAAKGLRRPSGALTCSYDNLVEPRADALGYSLTPPWIAESITCVFQRLGRIR
jgi:hypothetical protein